MSGAVKYNHTWINHEAAKQERPWLEKHSRRTKLLNHVASEIRLIVKTHNPRFYDKMFYQHLLKRLRKEASDNPLLLLLVLKGMDVHPTYPMEGLQRSVCIVKPEMDIIRVELHMLTAPTPGTFNATCYDYELIMLSWDESGYPPQVESQLSPWRSIDAPKAVMDFEFAKRAGITRWLLLSRIRLGEVIARENSYIASSRCEGMQIVEAGSYVAEDLQLLAERQIVVPATTSLREKDERARKGVVRGNSEL